MAAEQPEIDPPTMPMLRPSFEFATVNHLWGEGAATLPLIFSPPHAAFPRPSHFATGVGSVTLRLPADIEVTLELAVSVACQESGCSNIGCGTTI